MTLAIFISGSSVTTFSNSVSTENLSFINSQNQTKTLNLTINKTIKRAEITLIGYNSSINLTNKNNPSSISGIFYNWSDIPFNANNFILTAQFPNPCAGRNYSIYNFTSGTWCKFNQTASSGGSCSQIIINRIFDLSLTACNSWRDFISTDNKVMFNLTTNQPSSSDVTLEFNYSSNGQYPNLTVYTNKTQVYFNETFNG